MRTRIQAMVLPSEVGEFAEDVARLFAELERNGSGRLTGECSPAVDVFETDDAVEIVVDVPNVEPHAIRVAAKGSGVLIVGEKAPRRGPGDATFHLVERGFGRFARLIRLSTPCDTGRAEATLERGELRIAIPKVAEQRGRRIAIPVVARA